MANLLGMQLISCMVILKLTLDAGVCICPHALAGIVPCVPARCWWSVHAILGGGVSHCGDTGMMVLGKRRIKRQRKRQNLRERSLIQISEFIIQIIDRVRLRFL